MTVVPPAELRIEGSWLVVVGGDWSDRRELTAEAVAELRCLGERYRALVDGGDEGAGLLSVGEELYRWLDGEAGWLGRLRSQLPPFVLEVQAPLDPGEADWTLLRAPWELLAKDGAFLAVDALLRYSPQRRLGVPVSTEGPDDHRLGLVFMASSPKGSVDLNYEEEELAVLAAAGGLGMDLEVEDSGDPEQLGERLTALSDWPVLHLSCHGHNAWRPKGEPEVSPQPVLLMETVEGRERPTRAADLVEMFGAAQPRLVFLSACLSAAARDGAEDGEVAHSLATALVRAGLPAVLGWDGSVADAAATAFAHELYAVLGRGLSPAEAASTARRRLLTGTPATGGGSEAKEVPPDLARRLEASAATLRRDWHLARLWLGPMGGGAVVGGTRKRRFVSAHHGHKVLLDKKDPDTQVASAEMFVGRRRELQRCLGALRHEEHAGVLLHGMGRLGKSSLAARLASRRPDLALAVVYKHYDAESVLQALDEALKGCSAARAILESGLERVREAREPEAKGEVLKSVLLDLLKGPCQQAGEERQPVLLLVDDLERILIADEKGARHRVDPSARPVLRALLKAFDPVLSSSRLLLTSRFPFRLEDGGRDLAAGLHEEQLASWNDTTQRKLSLRQVRGVGDAFKGGGRDERLALLSRVPDVSLGNPGLQDLLGEKLVLSSSVPIERAARVLDEMSAYLASDRQGSTLKEVALSDEAVREFLTGLAVDELLDLAGSDGAALLRSLLLFDLPVPRAVALSLAGGLGGDVARLLDLGLLDPFEDVVEGEALAVNLLAGARLPRPTEEERPALLGLALPVLFAAWGGADGRRRPYAADLELARLGLEAGSAEVVAASAADAVRGLERGHEARRAAELGQASITLLEAADHHLPLNLLANTADALSVIGEGAAVDCVLSKGMPSEGEAAADADPSALSRFLFARGQRELQAGRLDEAMATFEALTALQVERDNKHQWAVARGRIADILFWRGELDEALRIRREEEIPVYARLGDVRSIAVTQGEIADILFRRGDLNEALRIRREEEIPVYERLGDARSIAVTQGQIADILFQRGELDEALRIRREEQIPVYARLGDVREIAIAQGRIADILFQRGELDEALRIRREEEIPVYTRLGDVRSIAVTQGEIADILFRRGELDEALRIRREEEIPVYERLGDARSIAVTQGKIADILFQRGDLDEALRIRREEEIPVYERLGDVRSIAVAQGRIADILFQRGDLDEALRIRREEQIPVYERLGEVRSIAVTQGKIADILFQRGELDEALRIRREEEIPVYKRLGDVRSIAVTQGEIAHVLFMQEDPDGAIELHEKRLATCKQLGDQDGIAAALWDIAQIALHREQLDEAAPRLAEAYAIVERIGRAEGIAVVGDVFGQLLIAANRTQDGITVLTNSAAAYRKLGRNREASRMQEIIEQISNKGSEERQ